MSQTIQLNLALLLPNVDAADECVHWLSEALNNQKGIERPTSFVKTARPSCVSITTRHLFPLLCAAPGGKGWR